MKPGPRARVACWWWVTARSQGAAIILTTDQARVPAKEGQLADRQQETSSKEWSRWPSTPVSLAPHTETRVHTNAMGNRSE